MNYLYTHFPELVIPGNTLVEGWKVRKAGMNILSIEARGNHVDLNAILPFLYRYCAPYSPQAPSSADLTRSCASCGVGCTNMRPEHVVPCGEMFWCRCTTPIHMMCCYERPSFSACPTCHAELRKHKQLLELNISIVHANVIIDDVQEWIKFGEAFPDLRIWWNIALTKMPTSFFDVLDRPHTVMKYEQ